MVKRRPKPSRTHIKQLCCQTPTRRINLAWISFQSDGSISFGLNDKTYISPRFKEVLGIWNAYNRVGVQYTAPSDPNTLEAVQNPHFTYHPPGLFHFKEHDSSNDDALFRAIARLDVVLEQDLRMPWLRAASGPLSTLKTQGTRSGGVALDELVISVPNEDVSVCMEIDFLHRNAPNASTNLSAWCLPWSGGILRVSMSFTYPQIATLSWFHFY